MFNDHGKPIDNKVNDYLLVFQQVYDQFKAQVLAAENNLDQTT